VGGGVVSRAAKLYTNEREEIGCNARSASFMEREGGRLMTCFEEVCTLGIAK
jgi:hypothetical protein